jgi:dCTP diphosphatase
MDRERTEDVEVELADVLIYLARLADVLGVDLAAAAVAMTERNRNRFPPAELEL